MRRQVYVTGIVIAFVLLVANHASSQTASLTGYIKDQTGAVLANATVVVTSEATGFTRRADTNDQGLYVLAQLPPDLYTLVVEEPGFQRVLRPRLALDAAATRRVDIVLTVGAVADAVDVRAPERDLLHDTTGLGTLIKPDEVGNLPVNGRSIQKLIYLAPGIVPTSASRGAGEFSVNGQRASANYVTIDGVSGNVSTESSPSTGLSAWGNGTLPGFSPSGSSSNLFSLDAVEEVRIQTSSYAPEYGRMPGAQISVVTRSGGNMLSGSAYEYFRHDALDATDFFVNTNGLAKPELRFHTFGGTTGGPLRLGPTFFFANYEGQRLTLPRFRTTGVPTQAVRDRTSGALRALLNAFPLPNGPDLASGVGEFSTSFSDRSESDAGAVRMDYAPGVVRLFGRVAVSNIESRSSGGTGTGALSSLSSATGRTTTATFGANAAAGRHWFLEHRLNYTANSYEAQPGFDPINGAQPLPLDLVIPGGTNSAYVNVNLTTGVTGNFIEAGRSIGQSRQRQFNAVTSLTTVRNGHTLKLGTDIRYLSPVLDVPEVRATYQLGAVAALTGSTIGRVSVVRATPPDGALWNMSLFAQDQWQVNDRLALTYGLRWDVNPAPKASGDRRPYLVEHPEDPARTVPVTAADRFWRTWYGGVAPRGAAVYRLSRGSGHEQIIRAAAGLFYDVGWGGSTSALGRGFPFTSTRQLQNAALPLDANSVPPLPAPTDSPGTSTVYSFPDSPTLPRSVQWNVGYEYARGSRFSAAATYLAARGDDLTRSIRYDYSGTGAPFSVIQAVDTTGSSEYDALELRLRFRPLRAIDGEFSYTLGESTDNVSDDVNTGIPSEREDPARSLGPSDFDVRHAINWRVGATTPRWSGAASVLSDVSLYVSALYRSAMPTTPVYFRNIGFGTYTFRPDVVPGVPLYLEDDEYPGGRRVNPAAFQRPVEARQGTAGRNSVRGFPLSQIDLSIKKRVPLARLRVEVGVDVFNVFNTAQFDRPTLSVGNARFGLSTQTLASALGTGTSGRGLSPLFQPGGARSVQLVARTTF